MLLPLLLRILLQLNRQVNHRRISTGSSTSWCAQPAADSSSVAADDEEPAAEADEDAEEEPAEAEDEPEEADVQKRKKRKTHSIVV